MSEKKGMDSKNIVGNRDLNPKFKSFEENVWKCEF